jgi:hypothetical protein
MAVTRIAAAGGALASDDEIDVAKVGGGVFATRRGWSGSTRAMARRNSRV